MLHRQITFPQPMQIAVGDGMEGTGLGQTDFCLQDRLGKDIWAMGAELRPCQLYWQFGAFGNIVERDPDDVMLDRVGVGYLFANGDFHF